MGRQLVLGPVINLSREMPALRMRLPKVDGDLPLKKWTR